MSVPEPVLPAYDGACLSGVVGGLCSNPAASRAPWVPEPARGAERVVLLLLDGLGWNQMRDHAHLLPVLSSFVGGPVTTVVPSTTATALTSLTTGLAPADHGLVGYRMLLGGSVMNVLRWGDDSGDLRTRLEPEIVQSCPPFMGMRVPVLSRAELEGSGFTRAHLAGVKARGWRVSSSIPAGVRAALDGGDTFVYVYYDGIDKIAHERGFGAYYESELAHVDWLVARILDALPDDVVLAVTADHGQVHVGDATIRLDAEVSALVARQSGEGRFRWLHATRGRERELADECGRYEDVAWVVPRDRIVEEGWFGPRMSREVERRLGDVALVAREPVSFEDPAEAGGFPLVCRHGSLTPDEMLVPFVARRR